MSTSGPDDEAFVAFVRANSAGLYRTACLVTGSAAAAEDLVQDTLTALYPAWHRVQAADVPLAYVRRALLNRFVSTLRKRGRELPTTQLDLVAEPPDPHDPAAAVSDHDQVIRMLSTLPPRARTAVVCRYLHDMPDEQIADALNCRPGTVRSLLSRSLARLRADWADTATPGRAS